MLSRYLDAALKHARYEILQDDGSFYGEIPECSGVYANAPTLEECREELAQVLEDWLLLRIHSHMPVPTIDGIEIKVAEEPVA